jgi:hypothetical protein
MKNDNLIKLTITECFSKLSLILKFLIFALSQFLKLENKQIQTFQNLMPNDKSAVLRNFTTKPQ